MGYKPTIVVLVLALLSVLAAVYVHRSDPAGAARTRATSQPLVTAQQLPVDSVTRITLERRGGQRMVFERSGPSWMQVEPFAYPMDRFSMRQLAAVAQQVDVVQRLTPAARGDGLSDAGLGLDPPEATLTYEWQDDGGGSLRLHLGRRGIAGRAYLRMNDDEDVLVVRQDLHERAVDMDPKEWRDRTIFHNVGVESDRILRSDGRTRMELRRERREWRMIFPAETRLDEEALDGFMKALGGARSAGFIADQPRDLSRFGLNPPAAELTVIGTRITDEGERVAGAEQQRLLIGMPVGAGTQDRYGMIEGRPTVIRVPVAVLQSLFRQPRTLVDPTGSGMIAADVKSLRILTATSELRLEREMDRWRATSHNNQSVPAGYVQELLAQLTELRAGEVLIQRYPDDLEVAMVTMFSFTGGPIDTVRVVHDPESNILALENGDGVLRVFPSGFNMRLTPEDFALEGVLE